jgi:hypothetical protein
LSFARSVRRYWNATRNLSQALGGTRVVELIREGNHGYCLDERGQRHVSGRGGGKCSGCDSRR